MSKSRFITGSRTALVCGFFTLITYGCSSEPADGGDDGGSGSGGSAGTAVGGSGPTGGTTSTGGTATTGGTTSTGGTATTGGTTSTGGTATTGGTTSTGGTATGGTPATGGSGGDGTSGSGGAGTTGGSAGSGTAGSGTAGSGTAGTGAGMVNVDPECSGIKSDMACPVQGKSCPNLVCGLGDTGRRSCDCATNWTCMSCDFANSIVRTKPANADTQCVGAVDGMPCTGTPDTPDSVCRNGTDTSKPYCMCATNPKAPSDPPEWNCDKGPTGWPAPT